MNADMRDTIIAFYLILSICLIVNTIWIYWKKRAITHLQLDIKNISIGKFNQWEAQINEQSINAKQKTIKTHKRSLKIAIGILVVLLLFVILSIITFAYKGNLS